MSADAPISRRELLGGTVSALAAGAGMPGLSPAGGRPRKIVVVGAHPDDPESGCGGTVARYTALGHAVAFFYLTRGEAGIEGKGHVEAARIRTAEAEQACAVLQARAVFLDQVDGATELNSAHYASFAARLSQEQPDLLLAHWPVDSARDHRVASNLAYDAWLQLSRAFPLYYYEVMSGMQTQHFHPTHYVDISAVAARKREACFAHRSQEPERLWAVHDGMHRFRGAEAGLPLAEAFVRHVKSPVDLEHL